MEQWLPFVENNWSYGRALAREAIQQGLTPVLLSKAPSRYDYLPRDGYRALEVDTADKSALLDVCRELASTGRLTGITAGYEPYLPMAAELAGDLGLAGASSKAIRTCIDKEAMRMALTISGVGSPLYRASGEVDSAVLAARELGLPVVLKPVEGGGSVGVRLCRTLDDVRSHARYLLHESRDERGLPLPRRLLVEQAVEGPEYSVEVLSGVIVGITGKHLGDLPYFVESGHDFPSSTPDDQAENLKKVTLDALETVGLTWGPAHVELRYAETGPKVMEINPRLGGGHISTLVRLARGLDLYRATIRSIRGLDPDMAMTQRKFAAIRFVVPKVAGVLVESHGVDSACRMSGIHEATVSIKVGDYVPIYHDSRDRVGHVIAVGDTPFIAGQRAEMARDTITLQIDATHYPYNTD